MNKIIKSEELITAIQALAKEYEEKEMRAAELIVANNELVFQNDEKEKRAAELIIANKELVFQNEEKEKRAAELIVANKELAFQNKEKEKRAAELIIANKELVFQNGEKEKRAAELIIANEELLFQNEEKEKRAAELIIANTELVFQNEEKEKRAAELIVANKELAFQNEEKEKRAAELIIANKELVFQNGEKEKRAAELIIANKELAFQNGEKEKRAAELDIANKELAFQNGEKEKRAAELNIANKELIFQNEEKEKRSTELDAANKELVAFNYVAGHDLQEPLRKIQIFASLILEKETNKLTEKGRDYFARMQEATSRMQQLIVDLLAYSRIKAIDRKLEATDLLEIITDVRYELKDNIEDKQAKIIANQLCTASIIPFQFRQLVYNLFSNALKFSNPAINPEITIEATIVGRDIADSRINKPSQVYVTNATSYCHITFSDNGIGFDPQFSQRIFEVFQKLHSHTEFAGTGIGLAIVKKIVDNHNGYIMASSEMGKGASFDIYIPHIQLNN